MRILIAGATSMIGLALEKKLLEDGHQIVAVTRRMTQALHQIKNAQNVSVVLCSMDEYYHISDWLTGEIDAAVLLSWNGTRGANRNDKELQQHNVEYNMALVEQLIKLGCKRFVTAGSQAEYGPHHDQIRETSSCTPNTEYGKAKLRFYEETSRLCNECGAVCIEPRFFSLYGPGDYKDTMVISTLNKLLRNEECPLTLGTQMWDYLYIDDACDALAAVCVNESVPSGVYNFGSGDVRPLREYILEMNRLCGGNGKLRFGAVPYPPTGMVSLWPDVSKLKNTLHWEPKISFHDGVRTILDGMQEKQ